MKGYAYIEKGKAEWIELEKPVAHGIDAVVRPIVVSPCTSDVHNVEYGYAEHGIVLGHEAVAEIVQVGEDVKDFKPGDIVAVSAITPDWRTVLTQKGLHQHCSGPMTGNILANKTNGFFADYTLVRDADMNMAKVPDGVSLEAACMVTDMMTTGFYGAEKANINFGDTVLVLGIGPVGLMAVAGAKLKGAGRIMAVGSRPVCVEAARYYGATDIINYRDGDITKQVYKMTDKQGVDSVIIAGGDENALNQAVSMARYGGTISNVNYFTFVGDLPLTNHRWGYGMANKTIFGGLTPGGRARLEGLLSMVKHGRVDLDRLVTHKLTGSENIETAFNLMAEKPKDLIKVCVSL